MNINEVVESIFPVPGDDNSIAYLCHHLSPLQMASLIHFLRENAEENEEDAGAYREIEHKIYRLLVGNCGDAEAARYLKINNPNKQ